jgi:TusA-related sulfurtransferase
VTDAGRLDVGELELGGGLETLVSATLVGIEAGGELEVLSGSELTVGEVAIWARHAGHEVVAEEAKPGSQSRFAVRLRRGASEPERKAGRIEPPALEGGEFGTEMLRATVGPSPAAADPNRGMVPLGALAGEGISGKAWLRNDRDLLWAEQLGRLVDRSSKSQRSATTDVPWEAAKELSPEMERAVAQVMTYVAQNEYAAYYVPSRYLSEVNPEFLELLMWLSSHVHDEARHIEVFTKRAVLGGVCSPALESTDLSLQTLLDEHDFTNSALLLNVLGEGTFTDLLAFIAEHAPDRATATAAALARRDEQRHVYFGIAHVRRRLESDPEQREVLIAAVEARASKLSTLTGLSPVVKESLVLMSARSRHPTDIAEAGNAVRRMLEGMHHNRIKRLQGAGFDARSARHLSELHTVNLM